MENIFQSTWTKSKLLIKGLIIGLLVLILQIPAIYIKDLVAEREGRQKEATNEVSSKWAGKQKVSGPVLVLPYWRYDGDTLLNRQRSRHLAYFLPDDLSLRSTLTPIEKYRGIYKVMLYSAKVDLSGNFSNVQLDKLKIMPGDMSWNEAYIQLYVADAKGLNDEVKLNWNSQLLSLSPDTYREAGMQSLVSPVSITGLEDLKHISFSSTLHFNGSEELSFFPSARATSVELSSSWPHPSFSGADLPQYTQVKDSGFAAVWKTMAYKSSVPLQWSDDAFNVTHATNAFGVSLFVPVNDYQKVMRSVKYAALCILLTFAAFFLIETTHKRSVHPFQYALIGLALILFYTLLLSFSEYIGFNFSYVVASLATIGLIAWFVRGLLHSSRLGLLLSVILLLVYTYVFTILQLQDYSLVLGSVGLFLTLGVIMHFSKKIQW